MVAYIRRLQHNTGWLGESWQGSLACLEELKGVLELCYVLCHSRSELETVHFGATRGTTYIWRERRACGVV